MKTLFKKLSILVLLLSILSCSKDDTPANNGSAATSGSGSFGGNIQVTNDPQTLLGYINNATVTVNTNGTIKITGDGGFDREFTGTLLAGSTPTATLINLTKQTKPTEKNVSGNVVISGNEVSVDLNIADDAVQVVGTTNPTAFSIAGKLKMLGTNFIRK